MMARRREGRREGSRGHAAAPSNIVLAIAALFAVQAVRADAALTCTLTDCDAAGSPSTCAHFNSAMPIASCGACESEAALFNGVPKCACVAACERASASKRRRSAR